MEIYELYDLPIWCMAACYQDNENKEHYRKVPYTWQSDQWRRGGYNMRSNLHTIPELYAHKDTMRNGISWVEARYSLHGKVTLRYAMVLTNGLVCIDIDHVGDDPESNPIVQDIIKHCNSYAELSYSGHGVHIYGHGDLPNGLTSMRLHPPEYPNMEIEIYTCNEQKGDQIGNARCMVYTNKGITSITEVNDLTSVCHDLYAQYGNTLQQSSNDKVQFENRALTWDTKFKHHVHGDADTPPLAQDELHERLRKQLQRSHAPRTLAYYWYNYVREAQPFDESCEDLSMLIQLAFVCNGDAADMLMLFKESPYYQAKDDMHLKKWERQSYAGRTLSKAIEAYNNIQAGRQ